MPQGGLGGGKTRNGMETISSGEAGTAKGVSISKVNGMDSPAHQK